MDKKKQVGRSSEPELEDGSFWHKVVISRHFRTQMKFQFRR